MPNLLLLLVQIAVVILAARGVGLLFRRIHQPQVMGEMVAGILLGPSFLGWALPDLSAQLFAPASLGFLSSISQVGLLVFMFLVGLELNPGLLRGRGHTAVVTSHVSITVPFFLGALLAVFLYPRLSDSSVTFTGFALFMGAAMSVTAFPVLARILTERNLLGTRVGVVTLACAAVDDVTAWCILAGVVVRVRADGAGLPLWITVAGSLAFVLVMLVVARRLLAGLERRYERRYWKEGSQTQKEIGADRSASISFSVASRELFLRVNPQQFFYCCTRLSVFLICIIVRVTKWRKKVIGYPCQEFGRFQHLCYCYSIVLLFSCVYRKCPKFHCQFV